MAFFITTLAHALVPLALVVALFPVVIDGRRQPGLDRPRPILSPALLLALLGGVGAGALLALIAAARATETSLGTGVRGVALVVGTATLLVLLAGLMLRRNRVTTTAHALIAPLAVAAYAAQGVFDAWDLSAVHSMTATDVVNTELIVNLAGIVVGLALIVALTVAARRVGRLAGAGVAAGVLAAALTMECVTGSARVMLGMLRLDWMAVTGGRVSYVAKVLMTDAVAVYVLLALLGLLAGAATVRRFKTGPAPSATANARARVDHRQRRGIALDQQRWRTGLAGLAVVLVATMLYQDLYATRPPSLSPAAPVTPDAARVVRIPVDSVKDGKLHRFSYVASDGHRVRFFLINRYDPEHVHIGVVYDACMICGDDGYIQRGEEIICIACGVRIFKPTIGKAGGCNPIPLVHSVEAGDIVIRAADLDKGARYFSEVVEITVTDPVTGGTLTNTDAPYQYEYGGRTFFFEGEDSYETFRANPEEFTAGLEPRYLRVQGHQNAEG